MLFEIERKAMVEDETTVYVKQILVLKTHKRLIAQLASMEDATVSEASNEAAASSPKFPIKTWMKLLLLR
ncbi:hypothetical protein MUK42_09930 [Musa troglodytarum]|uniref:Uncharacterized protein n=1 Tax=Musa troglodytarum TaxID=320322 RepID=A0A9E7FML3_9LILI|nr:hypothetical protein MUK42_09930 [Musa troglodytarum]